MTADAPRCAVCGSTSAVDGRTPAYSTRWGDVPARWAHTTCDADAVPAPPDQTDATTTPEADTDATPDAPRRRLTAITTADVDLPPVYGHAAWR